MKGISAALIIIFYSSLAAAHSILDLTINESEQISYDEKLAAVEYYLEANRIDAQPRHFLNCIAHHSSIAAPDFTYREIMGWCTNLVDHGDDLSQFDVAPW